MNQKYWDDLIAEGRALSLVAEGQEREFRVPLHAEDRAAVRLLADAFRKAVDDDRYRDPGRREHQLQDVVDAYRWSHPYAHRRVGARGEPKPDQ